MNAWQTLAPCCAAALGIVALLEARADARAGLDVRADARVRVDVRAGPRVLLEKPSGEVEARDLAGFDSADPRTLGAWIVRLEGLPAAVPTEKDAGAREALREERLEVTLPGGERLFGRLRGARAELIDVEIAGGVHIGLALDEIESLVFPARIPALGSVVLAHPPEGDRLYRRAGGGLDEIDGGVEEFTTDGVRIHGESVGSKLVPWSEVAALYVEVLADTVQPETKPQKRPADGGVPLALDLTDGSRLRGTLERLSAEGCRLRTRNGERVQVPAAAIALLAIDDGTIAFLSSVPPADAPPSLPFGDDLGMRWPHKVDRTVTGGPLAAGGKAFARGLGVHAPSRLTWKLDGGWKWMRGFAGVDDEVLRLPARGSVVFRVLLDGKPRFESREMHAGDAPVAIGPVDLTGAAELTLEADLSDGSSVADRADWLHPVLWR